METKVLIFQLPRMGSITIKATKATLKKVIDMLQESYDTYDEAIAGEPVDAIVIEPDMGELRVVVTKGEATHLMNNYKGCPKGQVLMLRKSINERGEINRLAGGQMTFSDKLLESSFGE